MKEKKNIVGLIGFILSITSIITFGLTSFIGLILSIVGLIIAKDYNNDKKGLSIAGIVISSIMLLVFISLLSNSDSGTNNASNTTTESKTNSGIKVEDFANKDKTEVESWCDTNGIKCYFNDEYSDTVELNKIISQSVEKDKEISKGSIIRFYYSKGRQKTAEEIKNEFIASCAEYSYTDIARTPDNYKGKNAKFFGEVVQVSEGILNSVTLRVGVSCTKYQYIEGYSCPDIIYVTYVYKEGEPRILEDDMITLYGTINGLTSYTSVLGAKITIPEMTAKYIDINQ